MEQMNLSPEERRRRVEALRSRQQRGPSEPVNTDEAERAERERELRRRKALLKKKQREEQMLKHRRRTVLFVMAEMVLCLLLSITCYGLKMLNSYNYQELDKSIYKETQTNKGKENTAVSYVDITDESGQVVSVQEVTVPAEPSLTGYRNILLLGLDKGENGNRYGYDDEGRNADVIIIASINNDTGEIRLASVMRDLIIRLEDGAYRPYGKANDQYALSGLSDMVSMINRNFGLDIDEYVTFNWFAVATVINMMGGVEITIPDEAVLAQFNGYLTDVNSTTGLWAPQIDKPGTYKMSGTQAVAFCRIRKIDGWEDFGRTDNQREVIQKLFERAKELIKNGEISLMFDVAQTALSHVMTNLKLPDIIRMLPEINSYTMGGSMRLPESYDSDKYLGNYFSKYHIDYPLVATDFEQEVKNLHRFLFEETSYEPSDFIKKISREMYMDRKGQEY